MKKKEQEQQEMKRFQQSRADVIFRTRARERDDGSERGVRGDVCGLCPTMRNSDGGRLQHSDDNALRAATTTTTNSCDFGSSGFGGSGGSSANTAADKEERAPRVVGQPAHNEPGRDRPHTDFCVGLLQRPLVRPLQRHLLHARMHALTFSFSAGRSSAGKTRFPRSKRA